MMSGPGQLCNGDRISHLHQFPSSSVLKIEIFVFMHPGGKGPNPWKVPGARTCYNFTSEFAESFNSWHVSLHVVATPTVVRYSSPIGGHAIGNSF